MVGGWRDGWSSTWAGGHLDGGTVRSCGWWPHGRGHALTLVCPNLYWLWSMSRDPRSFSAPLRLSMNCPSGMAAGFRIRYLVASEDAQSRHGCPPPCPTLPCPVQPSVSPTAGGSPHRGCGWGSPCGRCGCPPAPRCSGAGASPVSCPSHLVRGVEWGGVSHQPHPPPSLTPPSSHLAPSAR